VLLGPGDVFFAVRGFRNVDDLNAQLDRWRTEWAHARPCPAIPSARSPKFSRRSASGSFRCSSIPSRPCTLTLAAMHEEVHILEQRVDHEQSLGWA